MAESIKHKQLKQIALRWIQQTGCVAFACEVSLHPLGTVDVYGVKAKGDVYIVEAKAFQSDLNADLRPKIRYGFRDLSKMDRIEITRTVDFIYYIISDGLDISNLPEFIGILSESGRIRRNAKRRPRQQTDKTKMDAFVKVAKACSWRAYGHVIRHEQEQLEFSIM
jgi:hypothetical protein